MPQLRNKHRLIPPLVWDLAILVLIVAGVAAAIAAHVALEDPDAWLPWEMRALSAARLLAGIATCVVAYGSFVEPLRLGVRRQRIALPVASPLQIAVAADLHVGPYKGARYVERVCAALMDAKPDVILLAGDFLFDDKADMGQLAPLASLRAPLGVYAVSGNHDSGHYITVSHRPFSTVDKTAELHKTLTKLGITMLHNEHRILEHGGGRFALAGIDDLWMQSADLKKALTGIPDDLPAILLSHHPDAILEEAAARADLVISGHTHGGQIRLPLLGPVGGVPSLLGRRYARGLFRFENGAQLFVTQGAGECLTRARLMCRPEVAVLEIGAGT